MDELRDGLTIDDSEVQELLSALDLKLYERAMRNALNKSARTIEKEVKGNFAAKFGTTTFEKIVAHKTYVKNKYLSTWVGIRLTNTRVDYRTLFLERGTKMRTNIRSTKGQAGGKNRGRVKGSFFFAKAKQTKARQAQEEFNRAVIDQINKIIKKYGNG